MASEIPFTIAFLAGVFSFLSPCVLPIVPGFMSYIIGQSYTDLLNSNKQNKFIVYREYMEEISVEKLRELIDSHWKEFD